ncbi:hypothetical protein STW0522CIT19_P20720 (plasmid) [Citrobacter freundii]|nr:hypothetical protein STW0522CIT01_P20600 [Citrobacter freundii]BBV38445.1 hypothetical protein STW0522CIT19_P20720 [Citrobacter freundii]
MHWSGHQLSYLFLLSVVTVSYVSGFAYRNDTNGER